MARSDVHGKEEGFNAHDEGSNADAPSLGSTFGEVEGVGHIPPLDGKDNHCSIEEIAVQVVDNEKALFTFVAEFFIDFRFIDPAGGWTGKECAVIHPAHVITCATEPKRDPEDEHSGVDPSGVVPLIEAKQTPFKHVR